MRRRAPLTALAFVFCLPALARAQQTDPGAGNSLPAGASGAAIVPPKDEAPANAPKKPVLIPPELTHDEGVLYPQQALDEGVDIVVRVRVIVTLDNTGHVKDAKVPDPQGHGFDEAAITAAKLLEFKPATRDGTPIAATIAHVYEFAPQPSRLQGKVLGPLGPLAGATVVVRAADGTERTATTAPNGSWTVDMLGKGSYHITVSATGFVPHQADQELRFGQVAESTDRLEPVPTATKSKEDENVQEVYVRGKPPPRDVTVHSLDQVELAHIPGTNGDALRSLLNLPGVARPPGIAGLLIVRGSAPQDTQVFVDGTEIPLVYHFGGLSSVVPTEMIDKLDFYPGNFSARYGRGMGGIVDVGLAEPKKDQLHGLVQVDLIDARMLAQGPLFDTGWTFSISGRRSWLDAWLKPVLQQAGAGVTAAPVYYDYQAVLQRSWDRGRQDFRVAMFGDDDRLALLLTSVNSSAPTLAGGLSSHTGFWRVQARYRNHFSDSLELRALAAVGGDYFSISLGNLSFDLTQYPITSRIELASKLAKDATMNFGLDLYYGPYDVSAVLPLPNTPGEPSGGPILSAPPVATHVTGALSRPGFYDELELTPWRGSRLVPGVRLDYSDDTKGWDLAPRFLARQDLTRGFPRTTLKAATGIYYQPPQPQETNAVFGQPGLRSNRATEYDVGMEQEVTRHVDLNMDGFYKQLDYQVVQGNGNSGTGRAYGLETLIRWKPDGRFFGWLAYTLSRSELRDAPGQPMHLSPFDQTHILTVLGSYDLGLGWRLGARFRLVSGDPYTSRTYGFYDENNASYLSQGAYPPYQQRYPLFHQLDIRVDKVWKFPKWTFSAYLDVQNVYNQGNVEGISTNYNATQQSYATGLPILPSLGMRAEL